MCLLFLWLNLFRQNQYDITKYITLLLVKMIGKKQQNDYLLSLLSHHSSSASLINNIMAQKQKQYESKIKQGQYQIRKMSFQFGSSFLDRKNIEKYRNSRQHLSTQLNMISKAMKQEQKKQMVFTDQQRKKFVKQMILQQKKLNKQKEEKLKLQQLKKIEVQQLKKKVQQNEAKQRIENKRREIQKRLQLFSQEKQRREQEMKYRNRQYKQVASQKLLAHRMVESYNKLQNITLQEKKKKLAAIRQIHKPITKEELNEHLQRIEQYKQIKKQQKQMQSSSRVSESNVQFYKSKWYKSVLKEEKVDEKKVAQQEKKVLQQLKDKAKKYSEYIKHNFVPQSDQKLQEQMAKRQPEPIKRKKAKQIRQMGINNLQYSKQKVISKQALQQKIKEKLNTNQVGDLAASKPKNYLQELKNNRRHSSLNEKFLQNINKNPAKVDKVRHYADSLEQRANRKEKLKRFGKQISQEQLDDLYIKALDAKLNLLQKQTK